MGTPHTAERQAWWPYSAGAPATMILDDRSVLVMDPVPALRTELMKAPRWVF